MGHVNMEDFENMCNGSGLSDGNDGCYIATAVYGSYDCPQVWTLRRFRDNWLKRWAAGRAFVRCYYAISPAMVARFGHVQWIRASIRKILDRFVSKLKQRGYQDTPYQDR